ncbi:hypothetical protein GQR58_014382 [Nymphon striatum]|nr:hypothetical protein GQR58_014382 [Nymphon striatum]
MKRRNDLIIRNSEELLERTDLNKTIHKRQKTETRAYNEKIVWSTIREGKIYKTAKKRLAIGRLEEKEIIKRIEEIEGTTPNLPYAKSMLINAPISHTEGMDSVLRRDRMKSIKILEIPDILSDVEELSDLSSDESEYELPSDSDSMSLDSSDELNSRDQVPDQPDVSSEALLDAVPTTQTTKVIYLSIQKNVNKPLNTTKHELEKFFGVSMCISIFKLPSCRKYWSKETRIPQIADTLNRDRWEEIKRNIHMVDNSTLAAPGQPEYDKLAKVPVSMPTWANMGFYMGRLWILGLQPSLSENQECIVTNDANVNICVSPQHFEETANQSDIEQSAEGDVFPDEVSESDISDVDGLFDSESNSNSWSSSSESESSNSDVDDFALADSLCEGFSQFNISLTAIQMLLSILRIYHPLLPKDPRTLLKTKTSYDVANVGGGFYHHFGIETSVMSEIQTNSQVEILDIQSVCLELNVDGLPLFKSSNTQFWPILGRIVKPYESKPFPIGIFSGDSKPSSIKDFLQNFVDEMIILRDTGIKIPETDHSIRVEISCVICDTPVRAFVKQAKGHSGYSGCDKCSQRGLWKGKMTFPDTNADQHLQLQAVHPKQYVERPNLLVVRLDRKVNVHLTRKVVQEQREQRQLLQLLLVGGGMAGAEDSSLPEGVTFPLETEEEANNLDDVLANPEAFAAVTNPNQPDPNDASVTDASVPTINDNVSSELNKSPEPKSAPFIRTSPYNLRNSYQKARLKLKQSCVNSDLQTDEEDQKRKRRYLKYVNSYHTILTSVLAPNRILDSSDEDIPEKQMYNPLPNPPAKLVFSSSSESSSRSTPQPASHRTPVSSGPEVITPSNSNARQDVPLPTATRMFILLEKVVQEQREQRKLLQLLLVGGGMAGAEDSSLPEGVTFPLETEEEANNLDDVLANPEAFAAVTDYTCHDERHELVITKWLAGARDRDGGRNKRVSNASRAENDDINDQTLS